MRLRSLGSLIVLLLTIHALHLPVLTDWVGELPANSTARELLLSAATGHHLGQTAPAALAPAPAASLGHSSAPSSRLRSRTGGGYLWCLFEAIRQVDRAEFSLIVTAVVASSLLFRFHPVRPRPAVAERARATGCRRQALLQVFRN